MGPARRSKSRTCQPPTGSTNWPSRRSASRSRAAQARGGRGRALRVRERRGRCADALVGDARPRRGARWQSRAGRRSGRGARGVRAGRRGQVVGVQRAGRTGSSSATTSAGVRRRLSTADHDLSRARHQRTRPSVSHDAAIGRVRQAPPIHRRERQDASQALTDASCALRGCAAPSEARIVKKTHRMTRGLRFASMRARRNEYPQWTKLRYRRAFHARVQSDCGNR